MTNLSYGPGYAVKWQVGFQDPATPIMEGIINMHNDLLAYMVAITLFVVWLLYRVIVKYEYTRRKHSTYLMQRPLPWKTTWVMPESATTIEVLWTIAPSFILLSIAVPAFALLYAMDEVIDPAITVKVVGHQWYWSYEYSDYEKTIGFDSYMINTDDLNPAEGQTLRLLEVDRQVVVPINTHVRIVVTSADVLHSWAVPSLGVKMDACPGRLNQTSLFITRPGIYHGQCSEICGVNHAFMPIAIKAVDLPSYITWVQTELANV